MYTSGLKLFYFIILQQTCNCKNMFLFIKTHYYLCNFNVFLLEIPITIVTIFLY